jgi:hypothetical protein
VSARLAHLALALYPLAYRRRYGAEMESLLEDGGATPATVFDLTRGALRAHLRPEPGVADAIPRDERLRRGLGAALVCWLLFAVAGLAFYKTTEGSPFEGGAGAPGVLGPLHLAIQILAVLGGVAVLVGAATIPAGLLSRRLPALARGCAAVLAVAMVGIAALTAAYLIALATSAPALAGEPNGPFDTPDVAVSLALQLAVMAIVAGPAALVALRTWRAATATAPAG